MTRKNLFILLPNFEIGGAERVVFQLLNFLDRSLFIITVIVLDHGSGPLKFQLPSDIRLISIGKSRVLFALLPLIANLRREKPEIIFSNLSHLNLGLAILRFLFPSKTIFIARESNIVSENVLLFPFSKCFSILYKVFYRNIDLIICQTSEMASDLIDNFMINQSKIKVIKNPLDIEEITLKSVEFHPKRPANLMFVACARLNYQKGFDILLKALADLERDDWAIWIIGEGSLADALKKLSRDLRIFNKVYFLGHQLNPYPYFKEADLMILSSRFEGMPNVVLESLALETPVVSTPAAGGLKSLLSKSDACVVAEEISPEALSKALKTFFQVKDNGSAPSELVQSNRAEIITKKFERAILQVKNENNPLY